MHTKNPQFKFSAARFAASTFGVLAGLGGLVHGIGEILQGSVAPEAIVIASWTQGPIATHMGGEPAMTVVPNLLLTGLLTSLVSLAVITWSVWFVERKHGGLVLILLSLAMLLVGGGFAPPLMGILAGVAGLGINSPHSWWRTHLPVSVRRMFAKLWPWVFGICALNGVFLVIGSLILVFVFDLNNPDLFVYSFFFAVLSLLLTILTGIAYDIQRDERVVVQSQGRLVMR
jgi:hypothetical protein